MSDKKRFTYKDYENCFFVVNSYMNGNTEIEIYQYDGPVATVTVNIEKLPKNQAYIKDYSENSGMTKFLISLDLVEYIGYKTSGYVIIPLVRLNLEKINEYIF
jgi:hypothetical protein